MVCIQRQRSKLDEDIILDCYLTLTGLFLVGYYFVENL